MSAELVRRAYEAGNAGDMEAFVEICDPEIEWRWPKGVVETDVFRGHEGLRQGFETWLEPWAAFRFDLREILERGDRVVAIVVYQARGRDAGVDVDQPIAHLWEFRDERAIRLRMFGDVDKARRRSSKTPRPGASERPGSRPAR
jgi:ketosteroid isomerase-like protein